jgi:hypothetical protein
MDRAAIGDAPKRREDVRFLTGRGGFSQSELALLLGASRPKINVALGMLEKAGAVGRTSDRLFCDPAKLAAIAQTEDP